MSATAKTRTASAPSATSTSATEIPTGPATVAEVEWLSLRPSAVQIDLSSVQLTPAGSVMLMRSFPSGSTVIVQLLFLSADCGFFRFALTMSASSSVNERSRNRR